MGNDRHGDVQWGWNVEKLHYDGEVDDYGGSHCACKGIYDCVAARHGSLDWTNSGLLNLQTGPVVNAVYVTSF